MKQDHSSAALLIAATLLAGCGGGPTDSAGLNGNGLPRGGDPVAVSGLVTIGPLTPVAREDEPNDGPLAGAHIRIDTPEGQTLSEVVSGADGRFAVSLLPGSYRFVPLEMSAGRFPETPAPLELTISGPRDDLQFEYDTGIR